MKRYRGVIALLYITGAMVLGGCGSTTEKFALDSLDHVCKDPRMQMCTRDYTPVCGVDRAGNTKTYSNGCTACSYENVMGHNSGPCETSDAKKQP